MAMTLKTVVEILNRNGTHNNFKLTELAAKRSAPHDDRTWVVVRFHNTKGNWKDFTTYRVELYEAIPHGWPLSDVACRLGCHEEELRIVAQRINGKWHPLRGGEANA